MSVLASTRGLLDWLDDRFNPIVLKELRQAVKSRFVVSILMLLLTLLMLIMTVFVINADGPRPLQGAHQDGLNLFLIFQAVLLGTCMLCVPIYVGGRLAAERASAASDLLYVTTIRPSAIVWGKLLAGMMVTVLIVSICAPFMVVTYLLRGIDPPTILFVLGIDALVVLAVTQLAVFIGALPTGWPAKAFLGLIFAVVSLMAFSFVTGSLMREVSSMGIGSQMDNWDFWLGALSVAAFWLGTIGLVFFLTTAMLATAPSNRAMPVRLYITAAWAVSLGLFIYLSVYTWLDPNGMVVWAAGAMFILFPALLMATSERDEIGPRLRRSIPRSPLLRGPAFLFFSGAAGGLLWAGLMIAATLVVAWASQSFMAHMYSFRNNEEILVALALTAVYLFAYAMLAVFLRRTCMRGPSAVLMTSAIALILIAVFSVSPMIAAYIQNPDRWDMNSDWWILLNPLGPLYRYDEPEFLWLASIIAGASALLFTLLNAPWFLRQIRAFQPLPATSISTAAKTVPPTQDASHG